MNEWLKMFSTNKNIALELRNSAVACNLDAILVLVQNLTLKASLACAFKAINNNMNIFVSIESAN